MSRHTRRQARSLSTGFLRTTSSRARSAEARIPTAHLRRPYPLAGDGQDADLPAPVPDSPRRSAGRVAMAIQRAASSEMRPNLFDDIVISSDLDAKGLGGVRLDR